MTTLSWQVPDNKNEVQQTNKEKGYIIHIRLEAYFIFR